MTENIRILLADDHTVVRQGFRALLEAEPDLTVVGEAENGRQAVQMTKELNPDVAVMDLAMPKLNGVEATRQIAREVPKTKVLVLSTYNDDEYVYRSTEAGAVGYLLKQTTAGELVKAVHEAKRGNRFFSPGVSQRLHDPRRNSLVRGASHTKRSHHLTRREAEVLQLVAEGKPNKQIADELSISIKTVEKHRQQLMNKLNIHDIAGLTRYAIAKGVVDIDTGSIK